VIVVGAGLAGLAAADSLRRAGADVQVFEARNRVGGRVWSRELPNGAVVEMGAEFILPGYAVLLEMVERFGLGLWDKGMRYGDREPRGGMGVDRSELLRDTGIVAQALRERSGAEPDVVAARFLEALAIAPGSREAILARLEVSAANTADVVSANELMGLAGHAEANCPSIAGGNQRLALALAGQIGGGLHLSTPVGRIAWAGSEIHASVRGGEERADACVVAVPGNVVDRIAFDPELPRTLADAIDRVVYGHAAKLFIPLREPAPPSAVLSVPERYWTWTATASGGAVQPVVSCFAGSAAALRRLRVHEGPATWIDSVARLRPDLSLDPAGAALSTWDQDPWAGAAYSTSTPSRPDPAILSRPAGRLVFCGEHTDGPFAALMEGALRSGLRAAEQVLRLAG
jgi:monoamine oxidase